jgi:hypothetical protein
MAAAGPTLTVSHWSTLSQLTNPEFYSTMAQRAWTLHLTPIGAIVMLAGLAMYWIPNRLVVDVWFATVLLFILATAEGNYYHEFHQLPMLLPAALYFGFAARPAFDGAWLRRVTPYGIGLAVSAAVLAAVGFWGVEQSRVVRELFRAGRAGSTTDHRRPAAPGGDPDRRAGHHRRIRPLRRQLTDSAVSRASARLELRRGVDYAGGDSASCATVTVHGFS